MEIKTEHLPYQKCHLKDYWLAWADGVQDDGESEFEAIENAKKNLIKTK